MEIYLSLFTHMRCRSLIFESNGRKDALNTKERDETRRDETGGSAVDVVTTARDPTRGRDGVVRHGGEGETQEAHR